MEKFNNKKISIYDLLSYIKERYRILTRGLDSNFIGELDDSDEESIFTYLKIEKDDEEAKEKIGLHKAENTVEILHDNNEETSDNEEEEAVYYKYLANDDSTLKCNILDDNKEVIYSLFFIKGGIFLKDCKTNVIVSMVNYDEKIMQFTIGVILSGNDTFFKKNSKSVSMASIIFKYIDEDLLLDGIKKIFNSKLLDKEITKNVLFLVKTASEAGQIKLFKYLLLNGYFLNIREIVNSILLSENIEMIKIAEQNWFKYLEPRDLLNVFYRADDDMVIYLFNKFPKFAKFLQDNIKDIVVDLFANRINSPAVAAFLLNKLTTDLKSEMDSAFLSAIRGGHFEVVKLLIEGYQIYKDDGFSLFEVIHYGLYIAVYSDQFKIVDYLLSKFQINLDARYGKTEETLLHCAARRKNKKIIDLLLLKNRKIQETQNKINFYSLDKSGCPALNYFVLNKDPLFYSLVMEYKINLNTLEKKSSITPFYCFVKIGDIRMVERYLKRGLININRQYGDRLETAIYVAVTANNIEMVKLLLECPGIELNLPVKDKYEGDEFDTPIIVSVEEENIDIEILRLLLSHKEIEVNIKDSCGSTAFQWAVIYGNVEKAKLLLSRDDLDVNAVDNAGSNAFYYCYTDGDGIEIEILNILLKDKRLKITTKELDLAEEAVIKGLEYLSGDIFEFFELAEKFRCKIMKNDTRLIDNNFIFNRIKELLELKGKMINEEEEEEEWEEENKNEKNKNYNITLLSIAIKDGNKEIFDMLISSEENINSLNSYGMPLLSVAINSRDIEFVKALLSRKDLDVNRVDSKLLKPINYAVRIAKIVEDFDILELLVNDLRFEISDEEINMLEQETNVFEQKDKKLDLNLKITNILREAKGRNDSIRSQKHLIKDMSGISKEFGDDDKHYDGKPL